MHVVGMHFTKARTSVSTTQARIAKPIKKFTEKIGYFLSQKSAKKSHIEEEPQLAPDKLFSFFLFLF
jgi:hypothetical protein